MDSVDSPKPKPRERYDPKPPLENRDSSQKQTSPRFCSFPAFFFFYRSPVGPAGTSWPPGPDLSHEMPMYPIPMMISCPKIERATKKNQQQHPQVSFGLPLNRKQKPPKTHQPASAPPPKEHAPARPAQPLGAPLGAPRRQVAAPVAPVKTEEPASPVSPGTLAAVRQGVFSATCPWKMVWGGGVEGGGWIFGLATHFWGGVRLFLGGSSPF